MQVLKALDTLKSKPPYRETLNIKVVPAEAKEIRAKAEKYTKGNMTALIRIAIQKFNPQKRDLKVVKLKVAKPKTKKTK